MSSKTVFVQGEEAEIIVSNVNEEVFVYQDDKEILRVNSAQGDRVLIPCPPRTKTNIRFELRTSVGEPYQTQIEVYVGGGVPAYRASLSGTSHPTPLVWRDNITLVKRGLAGSEQTVYNVHHETTTSELTSPKHKKISAPKK